MSDYPLILFAKVPQAGKVKTRLSPELSINEAADVAKALLTETLQLASNHWSGKVVLAIWPDTKDVFIQSLIEQFELEVIVQSEGDLGTKMFNAMEQVGYPCAVMGCDVPHLGEAELYKAHDLLVKHQNIIGPTKDGGYYLLGLQSGQPELFTKKLWGGDTVLEASLEIAEQKNFQFHQLDMMIDIDHYADLVKASAVLKSLQRFLKN